VGLAGDLVAGDIGEISRFMLQQSTAVAVATASTASAGGSGVRAE
jgi:hypothetical protein